jgi:hypothetical protein
MCHPQVDELSITLHHDYYKNRLTASRSDKILDSTEKTKLKNQKTSHKHHNNSRFSETPNNNDMNVYNRLYYKRENGGTHSLH